MNSAYLWVCASAGAFLGWAYEAHPEWLTWLPFVGG